MGYLLTFSQIIVDTDTVAIRRFPTSIQRILLLQYEDLQGNAPLLRRVVASESSNLGIADHI